MMRIFFILVICLAAMEVYGGNRLVDANVELTLEGISNLQGGIDERTRTLENLDITFEVDTANAGLWENGTLFVYFLGNHGDNPTEFIGDTQGSSNIEAYDTFKLYEAWYEHKWGGVAFLTGLHDYNSEFYALESAGLFMGSSFGVGPEVSQVGPSIFPTTSFAVRAAWTDATGAFLRTAVYEGIPGDPGNPKGTQLILKRDEGLFYALECGHETNDYRLAFGGWFHTTDYVDFAGVQRRNNGGGYVIGEYGFAEHYKAFVQLGNARSDRNMIDTYAGTGVTVDGLFSKKDQAGLAVAHARASRDYRQQ